MSYSGDFAEKLLNGILHKVAKEGTNVKSIIRKGSLWSGIRSAWQGMTGLGMTKAQSESLAAQDLYNRNLVRDTPSLQVEGMQRAGLNPAMMYQGSGPQTAPQVSQPSVGQPSFDALISLMSVINQGRLIGAQVKNIAADTTAKDIANDANKETLKNTMLANLEKLQQEVKTEQSKQAVNRMVAYWNQTQADNANILLDFEKELKRELAEKAEKEAWSISLNNQWKSDNILEFNELMLDILKADASNAEYISEINKVSADLKQGKGLDTFTIKGDSKVADVLNALIRITMALSSNGMLPSTSISGSISRVIK